MPQTRSHPIRQLEHNRNYRVQASGCNAIVTRLTTLQCRSGKTVHQRHLLALATLVAGQDGANPLTLCKLYNLSILPNALFGCELWHNISRSDMRQRLKHSQGFQRDRPSQPADHLHTVSLLHAYY